MSRSGFKVGDRVTHVDFNGAHGTVTGTTPGHEYIDVTLDGGDIWCVRWQNCRPVSAIPVVNWADERADVLNRFTEELAKATGDGSKKRQAGTKPPWYEDDSHEGAMFSHLTKWKRGELIDADSGAHPLVHLAWRALAIALRETGNIPKGS